MACPASPRLKKRRRPRTACSSCHRRKEKCDRQSPCSNCLNRTTPTQCHYDHLVSDSNIKTQSNESPATRLSTSPSNQLYETKDSTDTSSGEHDSPIETPDIDNAFASFYGDNAFLHLKELLRDDTSSDSADLDANLERVSRHPHEQEIWQYFDRMPEPEAVEMLVDHYFHAIFPLVILIQRCYFDRLYVEWLAIRVESPRPGINSLSKDLRNFPGMVFQMLALSLQYLTALDDPWKRLKIADMDSCMRLSQHFSENSRMLTHLLGSQSISIVGIQQALLRCSWLKNNGNGVDAWHVFGEATRHALYLGLHQQPAIDSSGLSPRDFWEDQYRRILWIYLMVWDSGLSAHLGRPRSLNLSDCQVVPPLDVPFPARPDQAALPSGEDHEPSTTSLFLALYMVYQEVDQLKSQDVEWRALPSRNAALRYRDRIEAVIGRISPYLRPDQPIRSLDRQHPYLPTFRLVVGNIIHVVIMDLHQRHIRHEDESRAAALDAALCSIEVMKQLQSVSSSLYHRTFATAFYTISAATLISAIVVLAPTESKHQRQRIEKSLEAAQARMLNITPTKKIANTGLIIVKMCFEKVRRAFQAIDGHVMSSPSEADSHQKQICDVNLQPEHSLVYKMSPELEDIAWANQWSTL